VELYNLKDDIGETKNLAEKLSGKTAEMRKKLHAWQKEVEAQLPALSSNYSK
jgi:hypothetical protein